MLWTILDVSSAGGMLSGQQTAPSREASCAFEHADVSVCRAIKDALIGPMCRGAGRYRRDARDRYRWRC